MIRTRCSSWKIVIKLMIKGCSSAAKIPTFEFDATRTNFKAEDAKMCLPPSSLKTYLILTLASEISNHQIRTQNHVGDFSSQRLHRAFQPAHVLLQLHLRADGVKDWIRSAAI